MGECILPLYLQHGHAGLQTALNQLKGMFGFVLHDSRDNSFIAVRDYLGIIPLYIGWGADGCVVVASELKAIANQCVRFQAFPPGHLYSSTTNSFVEWYAPAWYDEDLIPTQDLSLERLRTEFTDSVRRRMMSDVPWGVLLSGGLDSSLVASVAVRLLKENAAVCNPASGAPNNFGDRIHSFCIGLENSPDLAAAKKVASFLGTIHHTYTFTVQEGLDAVSDVIYSLETFDTTTIRAATPMYLMSRKIKALGVKMVLSGEGADEIFGGYLYFHKAPDAKEFHEETVRKMLALHQFDCNRANKSTSAWGVEARVPFLDKEFVRYSMDIDPAEKTCKGDLPGRDGCSMEKWVLRKAFDTKDEPYLPESVLWRQKEQFSDGVGYSWIDTLKDFAETQVTDAQMASAAKRFPVNTPMTKEGYRYRDIFEERFKGHKSAVESVPFELSVACSTGKAIEWDASFAAIVGGDASGRAVGGVHIDAYADVAESPTKKAKTK